MPKNADYPDPSDQRSSTPTPGQDDELEDTDEFEEDEDVDEDEDVETEDEM